ncbi:MULTISPECIES: hypothetical protein [unclassified Tychonema]|nr:MULTISPECIES: hypothetical protein [unclassified Tychonema]
MATSITPTPALDQHARSGKLERAIGPTHAIALKRSTNTRDRVN